MRAKSLTDVGVVVGGIIPDDEVAGLKEQGVAEVFAPGAPLEAIVEYLRANRPNRSPA